MASCLPCDLCDQHVGGVVAKGDSEFNLLSHSWNSKVRIAGEGKEIGNNTTTPLQHLNVSSLDHLPAVVRVNC